MLFVVGCWLNHFDENSLAVSVMGFVRSGLSKGGRVSCLDDEQLVIPYTHLSK